MTKGEQQVIRNIIKRLKERNLGCAVDRMYPSEAFDVAVRLLNEEEHEVASRIYLDTWVVPALELLLPDGGGHSVKGRDVELALKLSE